MKHPLLERLETFEIDRPGVALPFVDRLARENGWQPEFAARVFHEYRRFIFLAMRAGHPVTPSEEVDQAWHLHLCYTRSYWDDLCRGILGRPLHHGPTEGGPAEAAKYRDWYAATLASYQRLFGAAPPPDIWPDVGARFERAGEGRWVDGHSHWIVPKPSAAAVRRAGLVTAGSLALAGCAGLAAVKTADFPIGLILLIAVVLLVAWIIRRAGGGGGGSGGCGGGTGCGFFFGGGGGDSGCGSSGCGGGGCGGGGD